MLVWRTIFAQNVNGEERLICCASHALSKAEQIYCMSLQKRMAVIWDLRTFHYFVMRQPFEVLTDHSSLHWLCTVKGKSAMLHRWQVKLEEYQYNHCCQGSIPSISV